jgi:glycosyltransferase involved in cell wall biosynthesis
MRCWFRVRRIAQHTLDAIREATSARVVFYGHDLHFRAWKSSAMRSARPSTAPRSGQWNAWSAMPGPFGRRPVSLRDRSAGCCRARARHEGTGDHAVCVRASRHRADIASRSDVLFVAGFGHPPNIDAACWLVESVMPKVWARRPDVALSLVGSNPTEEVRALAGERVEVTGYVDDAELERRYRSARVAVVPLRFGAGVKSKVVEALHHGLPLVTTQVGAQGLPGVSAVCEVSDDADAIAAAILALLDDDALWLDRARLATPT